MDYHPEYDGFWYTEPVQQADVIMLTYPWKYQMNITTQIHDLTIYQKITVQNTPPMTYPIFMINWYYLNNFTFTDYFFNLSKQYIKGPFQIWTEHS